jgi:general transcription factor 3C polypeptide 3 (transcription factor C subunit 4)
MIHMSMALGYIHYGLKRQSENRQYHIMQGLSFLYKYYDSRKESAWVEERQEAHYNIARAYHMLGLTHLALPFYTKVLQEMQSETSATSATAEDLVRDAAYNLQTLYAMGGNFGVAKAITEDWLVI